MKKLLPLLYLTISLGVTSHLFSQSPQERLIGKWHLISSSGGMTGKGFPIKKGKVIEFTSDYIYLSYEGDTLKHTSTYQLVKSTSIYNRRDSVYLIEVGKGFIKQSFSVNKNRLLLRDECYDCHSRSYTRVLPVTFNR